MPPVKSSLDVVGSALSVLGRGMFVSGVLRSSEWGWVSPNPGAPSIFGASLVVWLMLAGALVVHGFIRWESRLVRTGGTPLADPEILRVRQLSGGLSMVLAQFLVQAGVFSAVPLFLSVVIGLSALETGIRILPLSIACSSRQWAFPNCGRAQIRRASSGSGPCRCSPESSSLSPA